MFVIFLLLLLNTSVFSQNGLIKSFYSSGNVESEMNYKDSIREGETKYFYENGNIKEERNYSNGRVEGLVKIYSESGKLKEVYVIENGRREGPTNLFDENGNYLSDINYEGGKLVIRPIFEPFYLSSNDGIKNNNIKNKAENTEPKVTQSKKVSDEFLLPPEIEEEKLGNDSAFFSAMEVMPEPVGGMETIFKKLIYPSEARNNEVEGIVKVRATIDEFGEVTDAQIVEGIGAGCDDVARNAVYFARFKPGLQKGKPVRTMITIPIKFNPEMSQN
jgi:TonB family protein